MKVKVTNSKGGFIYGKFYAKGSNLTLIDVEHSIDIDGEGDPVVITAKEQFSGSWMEVIGQKVKIEDKEPSKMNKKELVAALLNAEVNTPEGALKKDMVELLENHLTA